MSPKQFRNVSLMLVIAVLAFGSSGCTKAQGEDEHLEHHIPDYKPTSYAAAVEHIRLRQQRIVGRFQSATPDVLDRELSEMADIIGWLPELAADSSMKKTAWNQVQTTSRDLRGVYQKAKLALAASPRGQWPEDSSAVATMLQTLVAQIPADDSNQ